MCMTPRGVQSRYEFGAVLWLLSLALFALPAIAAEIGKLETHGSVCEATSPALVSNDDGVGEVQASCQDVRGSLLQVNSKMQSQPPISVPHDSAPTERSSQQGNFVALLAIVETLSHSSEKFPTIWVVVLSLFTAVCIVLCIVQLVGEHFNNDDPFKTSRQLQATPAKSGVTNTATSLPERRSPMTSQRNMAAGASPVPPGRPSSQGALTMGATSRHLCPGLVVPHGNECILAVPSVGSSSSTEIASLNVQDLDGKSVIQAEVVNPRAARGSAAMAQRPIVVLRAGSAPASSGSQQQPLLAYCKAAQDLGSRKSVYIYDARDELFAQMVKDPGHHRYVLTSGRISLQLFFNGDLQKHSVEVTNDQQARVADTQQAVMSFNPSGFYYKLRVVSNVDVGLMLCALFAIDCMELS